MTGSVVGLEEYGALRDGVLRLLREGKDAVEQVIVQETLRTYHGIGGLLDRYLLAQEERAEYGEQVVVRLAEEVGLSKTSLYRALGFFRLHPIFPTLGKLTWSHYLMLLALPTVEAQRLYEGAAVENGWSVRELEAQVRAGGVEEAVWVRRTVLRPDENLPALRGRLYMYRLVEGERDGVLRVDLGFGIQVAEEVEGAVGLRVGDRVEVERVGKKRYRAVAAPERKASFYSYAARVLKVVDGDTLWLDVDCGFRVWTRQKVRLRGIDAPELPTAEGVRAKDFVERVVPEGTRVAVTTTRPDRYDRYLADVFYLAGEEDAGVVLKEGVFLNRALLGTGEVARV